jgi:eukaryotic-like serine/threonine-protein kinase
LVGKTVGHYRVLERLGSGGMGVVYKAEDTMLGRIVALKFVPDELSSNPRALERFRREARIASSFDHPHICTIYEVAEHEGQVFIAMQYIEGETLAQRIAAGPLAIDQVLKWSMQFSDALDAAHRKGIIHRDIKPANILLTARAEAKILDFGLAKLSQPETNPAEALTLDSALTRPGMMLGTVLYMSPEQVKGFPLDPRTDIFSLGVVIYEMVTGRNPFWSDSPSSILVAVLEHEPAPLSRYASSVPPELERIVAKALRKDREERYQTVRDMLLDLKNLNESLTVGKFMRSASSQAIAGSAIAGMSGTNPAISEPLPGPAGPGATPAASTGGAEVTKRSWARNKLLLGSVLGAIVAAWFVHSAVQQKAYDSIAVLPFRNASGAAAMEYLGDGITQSLTRDLSKLGGFRVLASSAVGRYKGEDVDVSKLGSQLKVATILTGRFAEQDNNLTVNCELVDASNGTLLWSETYSQENTNLLALEDEITRRVAERLKPKLSAAEEKALAKRDTNNEDAYRLYLQGRHELNQVSVEGRKKAIGFFNQALQIDPNYALAYAGLAESHALLGFTDPPREQLPRAREAAKRALAIDDNQPDAHLILAFVLERFDWDWAGGDREYRRAIDLNPRSGWAHSLYALCLMQMEQWQGAVEEAQKSVELEPDLLPARINFGWVYYARRDDDHAIEQLNLALAMNQDSALAHYLLGSVFLQKGMLAEALRESQKAVSLSDDPIHLAGLARAYTAVRNKEEANRTLEKILALSMQRYVDASQVAGVYAAMGDNEKAFEWLEKALDQRALDLILVRIDPSYDKMRSDPRYKQLLLRMGISPELKLP